MLLVLGEATGQEADLLGSASHQTLTLHHTHLHNLVVGLTDWGRRHAGSGLQTVESFRGNRVPVSIFSLASLLRRLSSCGSSVGCS